MIELTNTLDNLVDQQLANYLANAWLLLKYWDNSALVSPWFFGKATIAILVVYITSICLHYKTFIDPMKRVSLYTRIELFLL